MATIAIKTDGRIRTMVLGALSYLGALCFIPLMISDNDEFVLFHARQGLILWGWSVLAGLSLFLPGIGKPFFAISSIIVLVLSVAGIASVAMRKAWKLPLVYSLSKAI
jgi:uncharacterized membrane protein